MSKFETISAKIQYLCTFIIFISSVLYLADENDSEVDDASDEESSSKPVDEVQNKNVVQHKEHLWAAFLTDTTKPNHSGENVDQSADKVRKIFLMFLSIFLIPYTSEGLALKAVG